MSADDCSVGDDTLKPYLGPQVGRHRRSAVAQRDRGSRARAVDLRDGHPQHAEVTQLRSQRFERTVGQVRDDHLHLGTSSFEVVAARTG
jgi:hypothetical protein